LDASVTRGRDRQTGKLFSNASPAALVPPDHPLRVTKHLADAALEYLSTDFAALYAPTGGPLIPPDMAQLRDAQLDGAGAGLPVSAR
jgi:hypothetical protein